MLFLLILSLIYPTMSWPDGAPCVHAAYESMNPLEAVEHQGGLQLSVPPYEIKVDQKCYWRNQPIGITLQGLNESVWFKGFVIQPFEWNNGKLGDRMGQLMRLDDNGSWQQQCFRYKNSATHSHDENKKHMRMWWKADEDSSTVQFVATVVKHQTMFWVRSVLSTPIPPCRISRFGIINYVPPLPTVPPPVKLFKMETNRVFGNERITPLVVQRTSSALFSEQNKNFPAKIITQEESLKLVSHTPRMKHIIPLPDGFHAIPAKEQNVNNMLPEQNGAGPIIPNLNLISTSPVQFSRQPSMIVKTNAPLSVDNSLPVTRPTIRQSSQLQPQLFKQEALRPLLHNCADRDGAGRCPSWTPYCRAPQFLAYMRTFCQKTCSFC